jgi:hypothetical protein
MGLVDEHSLHFLSSCQAEPLQVSPAAVHKARQLLNPASYVSL